MHALDFCHQSVWAELPSEVQHAARRCLLDLLGVAASGSTTTLSQVIRRHALAHFAAPNQGPSARLLVDGRRASPAGAALAGGMTIDSIDAHDGFNPAKGHAGCGVLPAWLALLDCTGDPSESEFMVGLVVGYELACRTATALHASAPDYHTSGAWVSVAVAALGARALGLNTEQSRHAIGIAEYHGPRSQMMRCIDHPTMLKDGSGWGAMAGVSAAFLAADDFSGAPALTVESPEVASHWADLGSHWRITEQYFKPYPVCRWAQPGIAAALALRAQHAFEADDITAVRIHTFHESARLHTTEPTNTEQAQYSLPFPVAAALLHGRVGVEHIDGQGLGDQQVLRLSKATTFVEEPAFDAAFPDRRMSRLCLVMRDGSELDSGIVESLGDPDQPLDDAALANKFEQLAGPVLGAPRCESIQDWISRVGGDEPLSAHADLLYNGAQL